MSQFKHERQIFAAHLETKKLRQTQPRMGILTAFLKIEKHLTADELYRIAKAECPELGYATVFRTLKLFCECGLARELVFENGATRYEHAYNHQHHDHLVCTECGKCIEVYDPAIERLQDAIFKRHNFEPKKHRMNLFGICQKCRK